MSVVSDPLGWGWNLFGTRAYPWTPYYPSALPYLQIPVLVAGLVASIGVGHTISRQVFGGKTPARRALVPLAAYLLLVTSVFLALYLG